MKELEEYLDARKRLCDAFGIDDVGSIEDYREFKFCSYGTHAGLSLDAVAYANCRIRKTGSGATAPIDWQEGRHGKVIDYCLADVEMTRRLLVKIQNCGKLKNPQTNLEIEIRRPSPEVKR